MQLAKDSLKLLAKKPLDPDYQDYERVVVKLEEWIHVSKVVHFSKAWILVLTS